MAMNDDGEGAAPFHIDVPTVDLSQLEQFHSGPRHRLFRGRSAEGPIVIKIPSGGVASARAVASIRHEYELLRNVDAPGTVRAIGLAHTHGGLALVMADAGAANLAQRIRSEPLSIADFFEVALQLAEAAAHLHAARITHRDINPYNVIWSAKHRRATLSDFAIATTLPALTIESASPAQLEGTLAYASPEQTGRTGRSVDARTDLYSLGATFYEMLTGRPPFASEDPVELVHAHLARQLSPPHELNAETPLAVSHIVSKLLEKEPEQRYQTAEALAFDLREARLQWRRFGPDASFPLGRRDAPRALSVPDKLYGRSEELQTLYEAFARVGEGGRELVLVTGAPGIGKSALIAHLGRVVGERHGLYIAGKFDQLQRSTPFSGLVQAFRSLARQLLTEPEPVLARWRARIEAAVAPNGQLLIDVVPELDQVLGPQPPVPDTDPFESRNRFHLVFTRFLRVFAQQDHPLVLFLDDLQWVDAASLQLLEQWLGDTGSRHLLLLGAYRDNDVGPSHPLALSLAELSNAGSEIHEIHLGPIGGDDVAQLAAEAFNKDVADTRSLADLIMRKAAGNPFFVRRLLHQMHAQGLIRFAPQSHAWAWDPTEIERAPIADNVLDLMVQAIERLPPVTQSLLQTGACIGHRFDLGALAELSGLSRTAAADQLWPALEDGLLLSVRETYKAPRHAGPFEDRLDALPAMVQFAHDRVQQAAYGLLGDERRRALHLDIGRRLLARADAGQLDERLFDIVDQLDLGEALIEDVGERRALVDLNLAAARKARASAAYRAAFDYLEVAMRHLPPTAWNAQPDLTFAIYREIAECAYLTGQHAAAEQLTEEALEHAPSKVAKADLYSLRVLAATVAGDWAGALRWGRVGLGVFDIAWPLEGLADANEAEAAAVMKNVGQRKIEELVDEPEVADEETCACMRLLSILGPPAYFSGADVLTFLVTKAANLSLSHGPSPYSAYAYVFYGALHNARTGEYDVGYAFGKLALALARRFGDRAEESRTLEVFGLVVHTWKAPLRDSLPLVKEGFRAGVESGELAYAAFNLNSVLINGLPAAIPLADLLADAEVALEFATKHRNRTSTEISIPFRQIARALMGTTRTPGSFDDDGFKEADFLKEAKGNQTALGFYWVARLQAAYLVGDYETARRSSQEAEDRILSGILGMITSAEHVFYTALTLAAECGGSPGAQDTALMDELRAHHRKLLVWADHCPQNFAHKAALVGAEIARLTGASLQAMKLYRAAIDEAARQLFIQDEALAHELRARFFQGEQEPALALAHFKAARERYQRWGATVKVRALEQACPECFAPEPRAPSLGVSIDSMALIKASQAISAQTVPERLFEQILRVAVEVAGAQKGVLVLRERGALMVRARVETAAAVSVSLGAAPLEHCADLPATILRYVVRLKEAVVLSDAAGGDAFAADPVVQQRKLRSLLCVPLIKHASVVGLLYLENNAMTGAFADELVEVVQVLSAQAVISLENSTLVEEMQQLNADLERQVAARTLARGRTWQLTPDLLGVLNADGYFEASNPAWRSVLGWSEADVASMRFSDFVHPEDQEKTQQAWEAAIHRGEPAMRFENRYRSKRGGWRWLSWVAIPEDDKIYCSARDITEAKAHAEALEKAEDALRQSQKMEAVGQLTGGIAHDFNNMLAVVIGSLDLLRRRLGAHDPRTLRYVDSASEAAQRAAQLTQRLLAFSRQQPLRPEPLSVNKLVSGMSELLRGSLGGDIRLECVLASGLWRVHADPNQLESALLNLAVNARDAMDGGGRLTIETQNAYLDPRYVADHLGVSPGQYVLIAVSDTGSGMPQDVIAKAFDPFFTTKAVGKGTGLGLSQVYGFVKQSGGHVKIYSEPGAGTSVKVYLPRLIGAEAPQSSDEADHDLPSGDSQEVILVVEDEPAVRQLSVDALAELGYRVLEADGAAAALRQLDAHPNISLLFTDVVMPEQNGARLAEEAKRRRPDLKVLFTTGYTRNAVVHNGVLDAGVQLIGKPFTIAELAAKVREVLDM